MTKLSLLICSLVARKPLLQRLLSVIEPQLTTEIEVLTDIDSGEKIIGRKRNDLLNKATGQYIAYIDDDDLISNDYIAKIIKSSNDTPDCCGFEGIITVNGKNPKRFIHSIRYKTWFEHEGIYYRCPNHLSPVKRELALQCGFPELNFGEDKEYSQKLLPLLHTENYIDGPIYYYEYLTNKSAKIIKPLVAQTTSPIRTMPAITRPAPTIQRLTPNVRKPTKYRLR